MKGRKGTKGGGRYAANILLTLRVTAEEKKRLMEQAEIGLLKHNFETLRQAKATSGVFERQEDALHNLTWAIQKISLRCHHDCQENQEYKS